MPPFRISTLRVLPLLAALLAVASVASAGPSSTNYLVQVEVSDIHVIGVGSNPTSNGDLVDLTVSSGQDCDGGDFVDLMFFGYEGANAYSECAEANDDDDAIDVTVVGAECTDRRDNYDVNLATTDHC